jgi:hypothetical protein
MLLYLRVSNAVVLHQILMGLLDTTRDQSSMRPVLHILHLKDAMMQAKREQPQAEYYLRLEVPNCCSGSVACRLAV